MRERRLPGVDRGRPITIDLDGRPVRAYAGEPIAVGLHASGAGVLSRSLKYHRPRGFFCLEGHCGGCLMRIDGVPNLRACMEPCGEGVRVEGQNAYPSPDLDVLGAVDFLFPGGMNHHTLMTGSRVMNAMASRVVRQLSGLGRLPDRAGAPPAPHEERRVDVAIVGAGPAGLAAAERTARAGLSTAVYDEHAAPGGSLLGDPRFGVAHAEGAAAAARAAGAELVAGATAIGVFPDDGGLLAVATPDHLVRVRARAHVYATGGYAQNLRFADNDRPGVIAARAAGRMLIQHRVRPGERVVVVGGDDLAAALARALIAAGSEVTLIDGARERLVAVTGTRWVRGAVVEDGRGVRRTLPCDLVAVSAPAAPASELIRQHGGEVELRPAAGGFAAVVDGDGRTTAAGVWACGDVTGYAGPEAARLAGVATGDAIARALAAEPGAQPGARP